MKTGRAWPALICAILIGAAPVAFGETFFGCVLEGYIGQMGSPVASVRVELYGANTASEIGGLLAAAWTDALGRYALSTTQAAEYYNIVELDLPGWASTGAASSGGTVKTNSWIQYAAPLRGQSLTDNNFWDLPPARADLVIVDLWVQAGAIHYQLRNIGTTAAMPGHRSLLLVDHVELAYDAIDVPLAPDQRLNRSFEFTWDCSLPTDTLCVVADADNTVPEVQEANNHLQKSVSCPDATPQIIAGPRVSEITHNTAVIAWDTDKDSDSLVRYDTIAEAFGKQQASGDLVQHHEIALTDLQPATVYHYIVLSSDQVDNGTYTKPHTFQTLALDDAEDPNVAIPDAGACSGRMLIAADASDNTSISKVEFSLDGKKIHTDFSPPFECPVDTEDYENGVHTLTATAFDQFGRHETATAFMNFENIMPDLMDPTVQIISPEDGEEVSMGTVEIFVHAHDERPGQPGSWSADRVEFYIDDVYRWTDSSSDLFSFTYPWVAGNLDAGQHMIKAVAYDDSGNSAEDSITITVSSPIVAIQELNLQITRLSLTRDGTQFRTGLRIEHPGTVPATATDITVEDRVVGFQPKLAPADDVTDARFDHVTKECKVDLGGSLTLAPGESVELYYHIVPILLEGSTTYEIGSETHLSYYGSGSTFYYEEPSIPEPGPIDVDAAFGEANYLIVTHPKRLFNHVGPSSTEVNDLLVHMAKLAVRRHGVLGYLDSYNAHALLARIKPGGDWSAQLAPSWENDEGFLLIVGENEVIPAQDASEIRASDNWYADTTGGDCRPELVVGRIIGNDCVALKTPIQAVLDCDWACSRALAVSGTGSRQTSFENNVDDIADILDDQCTVETIHWGDYATQADQLAEFLNHAADRDVIVFRDHGTPEEWTPALSPGDLPADFGSSCPVVFASACYTGMFEDTPEVNPAAGEFSIAEAFLFRGAAVYIGATEESWWNINNISGIDFFEYWTQHYVGPGVALRHVKQDRIDEGGIYKEDFVKEYNLYGDPKMGVCGSPAPDALQDPPPPDDPPAHLDIEIPNYEVNVREERDHVTIPGGSLLFLEGEPVVPFYIVRQEYPKGVRVQDAVLTDRSGLVTDTGLVLPIAEMDSDGLAPPPAGAAPGYGWFPETVYDWHTFDSDDGGTTLVIRLYPFYYNPVTSNVEFYKSYGLDIVATTSPVQLTDVSTDKKEYRAGDPVLVDIALTNTDTPQDVVCDAVIRSYGDRASADGLLLRLLDDVEGDASLQCRWDSSGFEPGTYALDVRLKDTDNRLLDRQTHVFQVGLNDCRITSFTARPDYPPAEQPVAIDLVFVNTGSLDITGRAVIRVQDTEGAVVQEFEHPFADLAPDEPRVFSDEWIPPDSEPYTVVAHVFYNGKATDVAVAHINRCGGGLLPGDLNRDCYINLLDLAILATRWLETPCEAPMWCGGLDMDTGGSVGLLDLRLLAARWLWCNDRADPACDAFWQTP